VVPHQAEQPVSGDGNFSGGRFMMAWGMTRFVDLLFGISRRADRLIAVKKWIELARTRGPADFPCDMAK
jgi:hypothetical protein